MKKAFIGSLLCVALFAAGPLMTRANDGKPAPRWKLTNTMAVLVSTDSLPVQPKATAKPATDSIKAVPKARNQSAPTPITAQIKPIKTIKPIIKPVIKILH